MNFPCVRIKSVQLNVVTYRNQGILSTKLLYIRAAIIISEV